MTDPIPCPNCGSTDTLTSLRARRYRLMQQKGLATPPAAAIPGKWPDLGIGDVAVGLAAGAAKARSEFATAIGAQASAESFGLALGHDARAPEGGLALGSSVVETCLDCGTMYAPNVKQERTALEAQIAELEAMEDLAGDCGHDPCPTCEKRHTPWCEPTIPETVEPWIGATVYDEHGTWLVCRPDWMDVLSGNTVAVQCRRDPDEGKRVASITSVSFSEERFWEFLRRSEKAWLLPSGGPGCCAPTCEGATCYGVYEDPTQPVAFACDGCCGHGNEDGWCRPLIKGKTSS